ncbi:HTH myb-type domain-containing protein [Caerostris extrusa]|uniref:HTH myb-type domain-containing protein n=1 Tax=Caerostris extrusa TaxID=172846 RepID=A0AAV4QRU2_CAEEX|nr:HTH myb-type domain-containing protein [Caerostris extrusa]
MEKNPELLTNANLVNCSREAPACSNTIPQNNCFPSVQIKVEPPSMDQESTSLPMVDYANATSLNLQDQREIDITSLKLKEELTFPGVELIPGLDVCSLGAESLNEIINSGTFENLSMSDLVQGTEISLPNTPMKPPLQDSIKYSFDGSIYEALKQEDQNDGLIPIPSSVMTKLASLKLWVL